MSDKEIVSFDVYRVPTRAPTGKYELSFKTRDGWFYIYTALNEGEPFVFKHKRRPDSTVSEDDVTPRTVKAFVDAHPSIELVDEKIVYRGTYPS